MVQIYGSRLPGDNETIFGSGAAQFGSQDFRFPLANGTVGSNGLYQYTRNLPNHLRLVGHEFRFQAEVVASGVPATSNWVSLRLE